MIQSFRDLDVYKDSYNLMLKVDEATRKLPQSEKGMLCSQMKRASRSIPANIAEGYARRLYLPDFKKHLITAIGESNEMEVHLETAKDLKLLPIDTCNLLIRGYLNLGGRISRLIKNWRKY